MAGGGAVDDEGAADGTCAAAVVAIAVDVVVADDAGGGVARMAMAVVSPALHLAFGLASDLPNFIDVILFIARPAGDPNKFIMPISCECDT